MAGKSPYSTELIEKCVQLYKNGTSIEALARDTGVPTRTLYRWCKTYGFTRTPIDPDTISNSLNFQNALEARAMSRSSATAWVDDVEATVNRLGTLHSDLIYDLHKLLQAAIHCSDPSPRAINSLSLTLDRHMSGLLRVTMHGRERLIDCTQALSVLEAWGFVVFRGETLREMFTEKED